MEHYVLIRSSYDPDHWATEDNALRLAIAEAVTVPSLLSQTNKDWKLAVLVHPEDEYLEERKELFSLCGNTVFVEVPLQAKNRADATYQSYKIDWLLELRLMDQAFVTTRIDDDDGFAPITLEEVRSVANNLEQTSAIVHPRGIRVWDNHYSMVYHDCNAMHSLYTTAEDGIDVYSYPHKKLKERLPANVQLRESLGWLWLRHNETLSGHKSAAKPLEEAVEKVFDVDWGFIRHHL